MRSAVVPQVAAALEMTTIPPQPTERRWRAQLRRQRGQPRGRLGTAARHPSLAHEHGRRRSSGAVGVAGG